VVLLNEVGLDPGIDHMVSEREAPFLSFALPDFLSLPLPHPSLSAFQLIMKAVNSIHSRGGVVRELVSLCGGLPDPVAADNPLKYKISWSPRGMLSAATNRWTPVRVICVYRTVHSTVHNNGQINYTTHICAVSSFVLISLTEIHTEDSFTCIDTAAICQ
jgi:hypothetical protein